MNRDNGCCKLCGKTISKLDDTGHWERADFICDHVVALCNGGRDWYEDPGMVNFQTLCLDCNKMKTRRDMRQFSKVRNPKKYLPVYDKNGFEIGLKVFESSLKFSQTQLITSFHAQTINHKP